jgi:hypothetical protein
MPHQIGFGYAPSSHMFPFRSESLTNDREKIGPTVRAPDTS